MNKNMNRIGLATALAAGLMLTSTWGIAAQEDCRSIADDAERLACYDRAATPPTPPPAAEKPPAAPATKAPAEAPTKKTPTEAPAKKTEPAPIEPAAKSAPPAAESSAGETSGPEYVELDETVGIEDLEKGDKDREIKIRGTVVRCEKDVRKKMMFFFDNGQIWKQKDNKKVPWSKCSFEVTISKDFFGYKMLPDGEKREIRISRIK